MLEVEAFNRKVIIESFNRVVSEFLAKELDPSSRQKTLIFCADDAHADMVVDLLKNAFAAHYGSVEDDAVIKITGTADKPLQLIRRFKNERNPNVAVAVDHSILVIAYRIMERRVGYEELGGDYFDRQSTEHLQRRLIWRLERMGLKVVVELAEAA